MKSNIEKDRQRGTKREGERGERSHVEKETFRIQVALEREELQ